MWFRVFLWNDKTIPFVIIGSFIYSLPLSVNRKCTTGGCSVSDSSLLWEGLICNEFKIASPPPLSTGLREWFAQSDERNAPPRIPVMVNMSSTSASSKKCLKPNDISVNSTSLDQNAASRNSALMDEYSDEDEDFQIAEPEQEVLFAFPRLYFWPLLHKF